MKLLVDIGNTRMKWACLEGGVLRDHGDCAYRELQAASGAEWERLPRPDAIYYASVAGDAVNQAFSQQVRQRWDLSLHRLETGVACCAVHNGYAKPQTLGVDRWAAMIAAHHLCDTAVCVVDCGSAMTVDVLDPEGQHLGGYIVPGLRLQQQALQSGTAAISLTSAEVTTSSWGRDTASGIWRGACEALAGTIERSQRELGETLGVPVTTFVTGGDAVMILPLLKFPVQHIDDLVLRGMAQMLTEMEV